jgi:hypothetical protein
MESSASGLSAKQAAHEAERARERRMAAWILVVTMAACAIVAMALTLFLQRP